jgi:DNA invertase Pin-like site-specific DNA recombinase
MFQMMGVVAKFELAMISERVKSGIERARANGTTLGGPRISPAKEAEILRLRAQEMGNLKFARNLNLGTSTVQRVVDQASPG